MKDEKIADMSECCKDGYDFIHLLLIKECNTRGSNLTYKIIQSTITQTNITQTLSRIYISTCRIKWVLSNLIKYALENGCSCPYWFILVFVKQG